MDVERRLLSAALRSQNIEPLLAHDLQPTHFIQREYGDRTPEPLPGEVYEWMLQHLRRFRTVPSIDLLNSRFPNFELSESTDGVAALMEEMLKIINKRLLEEHARYVARLADDPSMWLDGSIHVYEAAREFARSVPGGAGVTRFSDALNMLDLYREREATGRTPGVSFGVTWLDDLTYGIQSHEMMIIEAFLGQKKSSFAIKMCADAYFLRDQTPLFFSLEMEGHKLVERWIAMCAGFKYSALKRLQLGEGDLKKWEEIGEKAESSKLEKDVLVIDDVRRPSDDLIHSKIEQYQPDFAVIDTIDEVRAPSSCRTVWEQQDHVARELKGVARSTKKPMVAIAQANRDAAKDGASLDNIAGSITIARKADIAIGLHATNEMKSRHMCKITLLKNRDDAGEGTAKDMYFHPGTMTLRNWNPNDGIATKESK